MARNGAARSRNFREIATESKKADQIDDIGLAGKAGMWAAKKVGWGSQTAGEMAEGHRENAAKDTAVLAQLYTEQSKSNATLQQIYAAIQNGNAIVHGRTSRPYRCRAIRRGALPATEVSTYQNEGAHEDDVDLTTA